jgi:flavodoxin I
VVLLASGTWDVRGIEGQLNPHMRELLHDKAADLDLAGKPCACIALGDDRYFYTARAADHLEQFVRSHHGRALLPTLANAPLSVRRSRASTPIRRASAVQEQVASP